MRSDEHVTHDHPERESDPAATQQHAPAPDAEQRTHDQHADEQEQSAMHDNQSHCRHEQAHSHSHCGQLHHEGHPHGRGTGHGHGHGRRGGRHDHGAGSDPGHGFHGGSHSNRRGFGRGFGHTPGTDAGDRPTLARSIVKSARRIRRSGLSPEQLQHRIAATVSHADYVTTMRTLRRIGMDLRHQR